MKWIMAVAFVVTIPTAALSLPTCDYAGQSYSAGATVCECPSLVGEGGFATGGDAQVTSRRMVCSSEGWKSADSMCFDAKYKSSSASGHDDFNKLNAQYCPRLPINFGEIQKAISQETGKFIEAAPKSTIVFMVEGICKRFRLEAPCKALLDALAAQDGLTK
ncbi:hypothetical protein ABIF69_001547 [Bradyrhizobium japonicum]